MDFLFQAWFVTREGPRPREEGKREGEGQGRGGGRKGWERCEEGLDENVDMVREAGEELKGLQRYYCGVASAGS